MEETDILVPGEKFRGYLIEKLLGKGGMGAVYLARHELLDTLYAIKVLYPNIAWSNASYIKRFLREAKIATRVRHPNMVAVHDCGHDSEKHVYYLVMDYVVCGDLRQAIALSGRLPVDKALDIIYQASSALNAMQRFGVVHRDIKPENILLQTDGRVKLVDLGIAKASNLDDTTMTTSHAVYGTPAYVSPEQAEDASNVDTRADVYSLGMVLFELLAGKTPYDGLTPIKTITEVLGPKPTPDIRDYVKDIPSGVATLVRRMTEKNVAKRLKDPAAIMAEIEKLGYAGKVVPKVEYTPTGRTAIGVDYNEICKRLDEKPTVKMDTMSFAKDDPEIEAFLKKRKRATLMHRVLPIAIGLIILTIIALIVCL